MTSWPVRKGLTAYSVRTGSLRVEEGGTYCQNGSAHESTKVTPPHSLQWKMRSHFLNMSAPVEGNQDYRLYLQRKQHPSNRTAKSHRHPRRRTRTQNLPRLGRIPSVLAKEPANHIPRAHRIVHTRPLLPDTQPRRNRQRQPNRLDQQRLPAQKPLHDEPRNDAFNLRDSRAGRVRREFLDEHRSDVRKEGLFDPGKLHVSESGTDRQWRGVGTPYGKDNVEKVV